MKGRSFYTVLAVILAVFVFSISVSAQDLNPLFNENKVKNFLPHMTWYDVEQALKHTDMALIPVGSIEQHGKHLPLGTDSYAAIETSKLIAQEADVIVCPVTLAGLSEHHMDFPGTLTLKPKTFEAVLFETAQCLISHGFKKLTFYNGHGGNTTSIKNVIRKINQYTEATAFFLNDINVIPIAELRIPYDWHAGVGETSLMLYLTNPLVQMEMAENPDLTLPEIVEKINNVERRSSHLNTIASANMFTPKVSGKNAT
ncbi:MAG: creatininase family protein, partial [bacterium]|nr:creatininase family protein [bacterium]